MSCIASLLGVPADDARGAETRPPPERAASERVDRVFLDAVAPGRDARPSTKVYLRAETFAGEAVTGVGSAFELFDEGRRIAPDTIDVASLDERGESISWVIAIDASRAMMGKPFDRAREAALEFRRRAEKHDRFAILTFGSSVELVSPFGSSYVESRDTLRPLTADSTSRNARLLDGVWRAIELLRADDDTRTMRRFVVVFSNGEDRGSERGLDELIAFADGRPDRARIPIFSVGYARFGIADFEPLERLSHGTAGAFFETHSMDHLISTFGQIRLQMLRSYVARFPAKMDGRRRRIDVELGDKSDSRSALHPRLDDDEEQAAPIAAGFALLSVATLGCLAALRRSRRT